MWKWVFLAVLVPDPNYITIRVCPPAWDEQVVFLIWCPLPSRWCYVSIRDRLYNYQMLVQKGTIWTMGHGTSQGLWTEYRDRSNSCGNGSTIEQQTVHSLDHALQYRQKYMGLRQGTFEEINQSYFSDIIIDRIVVRAAPIN